MTFIETAVGARKSHAITIARRYEVVEIEEADEVPDPPLRPVALVTGDPALDHDPEKPTHEPEAEDPGIPESGDI